MSVEIALIAGSSVAGVISAAFLERMTRARSAAIKPLQKPSTNAVRTELVSSLFEKTLASEAITRVYEAAQAGRIDRLERDRLLVRYKEQLESLNLKISQLQPAADFSDNSELRNSLAGLLEERIGAIDRKLQELSKSGISPDTTLDSKVQKIIAESSKANTPIASRKTGSEEKSIEQLQNEIVEALDRLEQVEMDKD
jgi:hypothetical protein